MIFDQDLAISSRGTWPEQPLPPPPIFKNTQNAPIRFLFNSQGIVPFLVWGKPLINFTVTQGGLFFA